MAQCQEDTGEGWLMSQTERREKEEELGLQGTPRAWERSGGWVAGCLGWGEGQVPSLLVCPASLACPVLPEGRNKRNHEKRTRLRAPRPWPLKQGLQGCQREWLVWKLGTAMQLTMHFKGPPSLAATKGHFSQLCELVEGSKSWITVQERPPQRRPARGARVLRGSGAE